MAERLLEMGSAVVALKAGHRGLYLRSAGPERIPPTFDSSVWAKRELWVPCFKSNVVGTTGSGDATIAGFLAGVLHDLGPVEAMTGAVATGACNVEAADALGGIIPWSQVQERIARGWERLPLDINAEGWRFDARRDVWLGPKDGMAVN
jgi:sugar/nucleoside kinase (ribokinase family)